MSNCNLWLSVGIHSSLGTCTFYTLSGLVNLEPFVKEMSSQSIHSHYGHIINSYEWAWVWSIINTSFFLGCLVGAPLLHVIVHCFGRRDSVMLVRNVIFLVAVCITFSSVLLNSVEMLIVGRFLSGMAHVTTFFITTFVSECAPLNRRGRASMAIGIGRRAWTLVAVALTLPQVLGNDQLWTYALIMSFVPSFVHLLCTPFLPHSPKQLFAQRYHVNDITHAIRWYQGSQCDINKVLHEYEAEVALSKERASLRHMIAIKHLRWSLALCLASWCTPAFSGMMVIMSYSTSVIGSLGLNQNAAALFTLAMVQCPGVLVAIAATMLVEHSGHKPLLLIGIFMAIIGQLCLIISAQIAASVAGILGAVGMMLMMCGATAGSSVCTILPGELCPVAIRPLVMSYCTGLNFVLAVVSVFSFPPLHRAIGGGAVLVLFTVPSLLISVFLMLFMPEPKGKTVEEVLQKWLPTDST